MKKSLIIILSLALLSLVVCFTAFAQGTECSIVSTAIEIASKLRGLRVLKAVPCKLQNKTQVEAYLRNTLHTKIPPERIENEGVGFKLLGLIPQDYHYLDGLVSLYTSQLGGYYDPDKKYYAMADWMPDMMQMPIAVHELTHALQDQHYHLEEMVDSRTETSDSLMARSALIEGDATAVMLDYSRSLTGQRPIATENSVAGYMAQNLAGAMMSSSLQSAPQALQAILIFPYMSGLNFVHAILKTGGYRAVDKAFSRLPASTEQILHPEKYLRGESDFTEVENPRPPEEIAVQSKTPIFSDRIGEFVISTWLSAWVPVIKASDAASGWGGDKLALYQQTENRGPLLVWTVLWDTDKDAAEFFETLSEAFSKRFQTQPQKSENSISFPKTSIGNVQAKREGKKVVLLIG